MYEGAFSAGACISLLQKRYAETEALRSIFRADVLGFGVWMYFVGIARCMSRLKDNQPCVLAAENDNVKAYTLRVTGD